ncbi:hypothetical protein CYLTODRAFT_352701 [Cylindrobasidium torrendii FP15055 ss-10]|uniref:NAD(P)-binding protein n=1 Tax=Cylindrobasidium torrendii FP15055 ss-10 TaxID=1314674 RepID=A0A0D7BBN0_9AGAR|nr:hypothetical protein CYLTODRAFT_352701 [Cylindrobasidium torrendii FP15055 ss-10]
MKSNSSATLLWATAVPAIIIIGQLLRRLRRPKRLSSVLPSSERVLVLGGGTGVGKEIALQYYARGAKVIIVGRRPDKLAEVVAECKNQVKRDEDLLYFPGDISSVDDMLSLRDLLVKGMV